MKSYTDIEQSRKLAEILPIESADMRWVALNWQETEYYIEVKQDGINQPKKAVPCWSLAALLDVLPTFTIDSSDDHYFRVHCYAQYSEWHNNIVDACYELILKLKDRNSL